MAINPPNSEWTSEPYITTPSPSPVGSDVLISISGNVEHGGHSKATAEEVEQSLRGNYQLVDPQCASTTISGTVFKFSAWWQLEDEFTKMNSRIENLEMLLAKHERALPLYIPEEENLPAKKTTPKKRGRASKKTSA
jgi:hypothetical protein